MLLLLIRLVSARFSDFKSNEYANLIGGEVFEPVEENPMIGLRGASRYTSSEYKDAFLLECEAIKKVINDFGLDNLKLMIPFVRTVDEAKAVKEILIQQNVLNNNKKIDLFMMCEIPSNVILMDEFSEIFDGFSIGSNDLTQLVLGVDRDSGLLSNLFDERDPAVLKIIKMAIESAHKSKKYIGICGQAPSDFFDFAKYLIDLKIDSISLNPDAVIPFIFKFKS